MNILAKIMLALCCVLGCASLTFAQEQAKPAASDATSQDKSTIYLYRLKQFAGYALEPSVYMDDKELARMDNGRYFGVQVDPGKHTFRMGDKQTGFEIDMKAGQEYYAKVSIEIGAWKGHGRLSLMQPEQGTFEIKNVKPLSPGKIKNHTLVTIYEGSETKRTAEAQSTKQ